MITSINPATEEEIKSWPEDGPEAIDDALNKARWAYGQWRKTRLSERVNLVHKLADILHERMEDASALMSAEMGKTLAAGRAEITKCVQYCHYTADSARFFLEDEEADTEFKHTFTRPLPLGVILLVMPWNFPFWQVIRQAAATILAGNVCLLKHASSVPGCAVMLEELFEKAGFPEGVFQTLLIRHGAVAAILEDARVQGASLTGSERAGSSVAAICGKHIKPCVLELGGSDPFIVMPSADLDEALKHAIIGRMRNTGQSCIAAKRLIVHRDIYDDFRHGFIERMNAMTIGDPLDADTDLGPLSSRRALDEVRAQIREAVKQGARLTEGTQALPKTGFYLRPGILEGVTPEMAVYEQEIFAPVAQLYKVSSLDAAIELANDIPLGLSSVLFSKDKEEQQQAIMEIEAGSTYINRYASSNIHLPFGGIKRSGFGREMAREGLRAFTNLKTIVIAN